MCFLMKSNFKSKMKFHFSVLNGVSDYEYNEHDYNLTINCVYDLSFYVPPTLLGDI